MEAEQRMYQNRSVSGTSKTHELRPLRVGIGGPVGSGKTALVEALCKRLRDNYDIYVITNDIYPARRSRNQNRKQKFHHEGREEHEGRN